MTTTKPVDLKNKPNCYCDHKLQGSGAVFLQGEHWLMCNNCGGVQPIRKPITWGKDNDSHTTTPR